MASMSYETLPSTPLGPVPPLDDAAIIKRPEKLRERLLSLDIFRGFTMAFMLLVNYPGDGENVFAPLEHAEWNGMTPTDLVFPFFLFIVGVSAAFSLSSSYRRKSRSKVVLGIVRRSLVLILIGMALNAFPFAPLKTWFKFAHYRPFGVLQRIGACYLVCGLTLAFSLKGGSHVHITAGGKRLIAVVFTLLLTVYCALMYLWPVPGCGKRLIDSRICNAEAYIDRALFFGGSTAHLYRRRTWDPEGWLSTCTAAITMFCGFFVGRVLKGVRSSSGTAGAGSPEKQEGSALEKAGSVFRLGVVFTLVGLAFKYVFKIPFNKNLWSPSYAFLAAGLAAWVLVVVYVAVDTTWVSERTRRTWVKFTTPFFWMGTNAIFVFVASGIVVLTLFRFQAPVPDWVKDRLGCGALIPCASHPKATLYRLVYLCMYAMVPRLPAKVASLAFALIHVGASNAVKCYKLVALAALFLTVDTMGSAAPDFVKPDSMWMWVSGILYRHKLFFKV